MRKCITLEELENLEKAIKTTKSGSAKERLKLVYQYMLGLKIEEVADLNCVSKRTVNRCVKKYKEGGISALNPIYSKGAPRKISHHIHVLIAEIIETKFPKDYDLPQSYQWTLSLIKRMIELRFNISLSISAVFVLMERINFSYTVPTYTLARANKVKQEEFKKRFTHLRKQLHFGDIDHILFQDESAIRDYLALQKCWFPKGRQRIIKTYRQHLTVKLLGILNYETGHIYCEEREKYNAQTFVEFISNVLSIYTEGKIVMILDNARIHHAKVTKEFLGKYTNKLQLEFLPAYSPQFNLIEGLWGWMKSTVIRNRFFSKLYEVKKVVRDFVDYVNTVPNKVIERLCLRIN